MRPGRNPAPRGLMVLALMLVDCGSRVQFTRGARIPLNVYTVTVTHTDSVDIGKSAKNLVVHMRCEGVDSKDGFAKFLMNFFGRMIVVDGDGNEYNAQLKPLSAYRGGGAAPNEWVAIAKVPVKSRDFTFVIENASRLSGQPESAVVPLGP